MIGWISSLSSLLNSASITHPKYRPDIDGLRTVAVVSVLIFHGFPSLLPGGFVGVDVFFVISGFLISSIILKSLAANQFNIWKFYERRIRRLFPVLIVVLFFSLAVGWWFLTPLELQSLAKQTIGGAMFVANLVLAADSGYFSEVSDSNPLLHLWSLGIEEQFYLLWPLILWFFYWCKWPIWLALVFCLVSSFAYSYYLTLGNLKLAFYIPFSRFWEMIVGAVLAWWILQPGARSKIEENANYWDHFLSILGVVFFLIALATLSPSSQFPGWRASWPVLSALCFIAAGPYALVNRYVLSHPLMVWVGLISYPLYLWHWPLLAYFHGVSYAIDPQWHAPIVCSLLLLSVLLAWLSYRYIETPLRGGKFARPKILGLILAMLIIVGAASLIWINKGVSSRIKDEISGVISVNLRTPAWLESLRDGQCHNMIYRDPSLNAEVCLPTQQPSLVIWGDSHAAAMQQALQEWGAQNDIEVGQITIDATAPYFTTQKNNMGREFKQVSEAVLAQLQQRPPSVLVLHAFWVAHDIGSPDSMLKNMNQSLERIRQALPDTKIVVIGPIPNWKKNIGQNVFNYSVLHNDVIEPFTRFGLADTALHFDRYLKGSWSEVSNVHYIAATDYLCNEDQACLIRLPEQPVSVENMAYVDESHLSTAATQFVIHSISPTLKRLIFEESKEK